MATKEMYNKVKNLTKDEIILAAKHCCDDIQDIENYNFCDDCPYTDVRKWEDNPNRWCRQWLIHDLIKLI